MSVKFEFSLGDEEAGLLCGLIQEKVNEAALNATPLGDRPEIEYDWWKGHADILRKLLATVVNGSRRK